MLTAMLVILLLKDIGCCVLEKFAFPTKLGTPTEVAGFFTS